MVHPSLLLLLHQLVYLFHMVSDPDSLRVRDVGWTRANGFRMKEGGLTCASFPVSIAHHMHHIPARSGNRGSALHRSPLDLTPPSVPAGCYQTTQSDRPLSDELLSPFPPV